MARHLHLCFSFRAMDGQSSVPQVICPTWLTLSRWSDILLTSAQPLFTVNCLTIPPSYLK